MSARCVPHNAELCPFCPGWDEPESIDGGLARATDPATSKRAAPRVNANKWESLVLETLAWHPDSSIREVVEITGAPMECVSNRFRPLLNKGRIRITGTKMGRLGREVQTYRVVEQ